MPDGCTELLFDFGEAKRSQMAGQLSSAFEFQPSGAINLLGVRFHAHGIFPFLHLPLLEMTDRVVALHEVWNSLSKELGPRMFEASEDRRKIDLVEDLLLTMVGKRDLRPDTHVKNAVECIVSNEGQISIEELTRQIGLGRRQLERKFALQVGVSPKLYTRIIRFQKIINLVQKAEDYEWPDVLVDCGYYDQSHLIRDFKAFSGRTPSDYFNADETMARLFQLGKRKTYFYNTF
ncbi:MAG: AraC family transcriptional regulator [Ignavibacteria bacterium]|nr:AraC family transcriptional regulator [Ignavibacteria bacterium]